MPTLKPLGDIAGHRAPAIVDRSGTPDALARGPYHFSRAAAVLFTSLAVVMALWILASTILIVLQGQVAIPINDDWDRFITYVANHYSIEWFFHPHVDHRLVAPKILFMIDDRVFHGLGGFLSVCSFTFQTLTGCLLWILSRASCQQSRTESIFLAAIIASCVFSAQQWVNFVWPFQVQFPMVYCATLAALFALWKSTENTASRISSRWFACSIALATLATYSMANGTLTWPVLLMAAFWLRIRPRLIGILSAASLLLGATYFYHWHASSPPTHLAASERLPHAIVFFFAHLGSPTIPLGNLGNTENFRLTVACIPGALLFLTLAAGFVLLWLRRERFNKPRAMLVFFAIFLTGASAGMAYGRSEGRMLDVFEPRYLTPSYLFWLSILLAAWPLLRRASIVLPYAALCTGVLVGIVIHQSAVLIDVRHRAEMENLAAVAVVNNVTDPDAWHWLYHTPKIAMDTIDYLRNNNMTVFTEEWTHWPGIPLNRRFLIDSTPGACQGDAEEAVAIPSPVKPGWRINGWAWDRKAGRSPLSIVLGDDAGLIAGVGRTGTPLPPALAALPMKYVAASWSGYVSGQPRVITAYLVEADNRSLCAIGKQQLRRPASEVQFSELGPRLPDTRPEITGGWTPDAFYHGPGGPGPLPADGQVFGSYPDRNTGSLGLGPFHLDGHTQIGVPIVTGPDTHDLAVFVRDATTKEVYAQISPPPIRQAWWAWRPELPQGRELNIEIYAEDKGSAWGQWLAVGSPHTLR